MNIMKEKLAEFRPLFKIAFSKNNDLRTEEGRNNERLKRIAWTSLAALFAQILQMAIPLITVRITLRYMGSEIYALWMTVNSLFSLMTYADMGLGNGLQTRLSQENGKDGSSNEKRIVSSTYFALTVIAFIFALISIILLPRLNWGKIVGTQGSGVEQLTLSVILAILIPKIITIPVSLVNRCQNAMQSGFISYLWQGISSILSLISIYIAIEFDMGVVSVILISSSIQIVVYVLNSIIYFCDKRNETIRPSLSAVSKEEIRISLALGINFFVLSILNAASLNMDNFIVAKASALGSVTNYALALRVTQLINVACTVLSAPLWAANGEAMARGDFEWVRKTTRKISRLSVVIVLITIIVLLSIGPMLFNIWLGYEVGISRLLLLGLLLVQLAYAFISPYFMVLNASGRVGFQILVFAVFAPISITGKFIACKYLGIEYLPYAGAILYTCFVVLPVYLLVNKQLMMERIK